MKKANTKMKGFTIVELIGIIAILGVILAIAVPTIGNVISNSYMKAYEIDLKSMEDAAKSYVLKKNIKLEPGENRQIQIYELVDEALIDPILDPRTKEECTGHVTVIDYNDSYKFNSCLKCGTNYISDDCNKTDFIIPTMTLLGDNPVNMYIGETYRDEGATAHDNVNGDITDKIIVTGYVNPDKPGAYTLTYSVEDSEGNEALPLTRTINVIDNVKPIITFKPNGNTTYAKNRSVELNVRDPNSGIKSGSLKYLWNTSTSAPSEESITTSFTNGGSINSPSGVTGSYYLWILARDNSGNTTIERSNVFNLDNTPPAVPTITANPTALTNGNVTVSVSYPTDATIKKVSVNNGSTWSDYTGTLVVTSNTTLLAYATDSSGNQSNNAKYTISNIDKTNPVITTTLKSSQKADFSTWSLTGGAYINGNGEVVLPTTGSSRVTSPYMPAMGTPWELQVKGITSSASPYYTPKGGVLLGSNYYDSSYVAAVASNGYSGNGKAQELPLNTLTPFSWKGGNGTDVYYVRINIRSDGNYGVSPITVSDFKFITEGKSNYGKIIYATTSDSSGIKTTKWLAGAKTVNDFASAGNTLNSSFEVTSNGTYTIYTEDKAGNKAIKQVVINDIDTSYPTVSFGTNGNATYATTRSTKVTVSDNVGINTNGLKYVWTTSTTAPSPSAFTVTFTSGATISTPPGLTGGYYLWISAQDTAGNTTITRSNVFNLDNTSPTVTAKGSSYTITEGASNVISSTYFNITANGTAPITSTTCVDTSKNNVAVTNTSTLAVGTHVVKCTVTKQNGLSSNAQTTIVVNPAYTCSVGTLTNDPVKGYICVTNASTGSSCNSCTYTTSTYGQNCSECGSTCNTCTYQTTTTGPHCDNCGTTCRSCSYVVYTSASCSAYPGSPTCASSDISSSCTKSGSGCPGPCIGGGYTACTRDSGCSGGWRCSSYYASYSCPSGYSLDGSSCWKSVKGPNCDKCGEMCASCTYTTSITGSNCSECGSTCSSCTYTTSTYGPNCSECGSYTTYYCSSGWSSYSGSGK